MDLPTYTNIWRIEKRLYKLYDLRLPMPLPIVWIGVFVGVFVPWSLLLWLVGVPVAMPWHVLFLVPPGIVTWLSTRPVIEGKRLTELLESQLRYLGEPKAWYRLASLSEPDTVTFSGRVWRAYPARVKARRPARKPSRKRAPATGPRQVRPAVAAAAAAAGQAPVASTQLSVTVAEPARQLPVGAAEPARTGWGSRTRAGTAPALPASGAPEAGETSASHEAARTSETARADRTGLGETAAAPGSGGTAADPGAASSPELRRQLHLVRDDGAADATGEVDTPQPGPEPGRAPAEDGTRDTAGRRPRQGAGGKPIDTEALRRLRKLAASADGPPPGDTAPERVPEDEAARSQHRKGQPPKLNPALLAEAQRSWAPLTPDSRPVTLSRPLRDHGPQQTFPVRRDETPTASPGNAPAQGSPEQPVPGTTPASGPSVPVAPGSVPAEGPPVPDVLGPAGQPVDSYEEVSSVPDPEGSSGERNEASADVRAGSRVTDERRDDAGQAAASAPPGVSVDEGPAIVRAHTDRSATGLSTGEEPAAARDRSAAPATAEVSAGEAAVARDRVDRSAAEAGVGPAVVRDRTDRSATELSTGEEPATARDRMERSAAPGTARVETSTAEVRAGEEPAVARDRVDRSAAEAGVGPAVVRDRTDRSAEVGSGEEPAVARGRTERSGELGTGEELGAARSEGPSAGVSADEEPAARIVEAGTREGSAVVRDRSAAEVGTGEEAAGRAETSVDEVRPVSSGRPQLRAVAADPDVQDEVVAGEHAAVSPGGEHGSGTGVRREARPGIRQGADSEARPGVASGLGHGAGAGVAREDADQRSRPGDAPGLGHGAGAGVAREDVERGAGSGGAPGVDVGRGPRLGDGGEGLGVPGPRAGEARVRRVESVVGRDSGGWRRVARVVVGGGGMRGDGSEIDEARARGVFGGSRRTVVLGCTVGAGQSTTALMLGHTLAHYRDDRVVAVDASSGADTLSSRIESETPETLTSLLAGLHQVGGYLRMRGYTTRTSSGLEVVGADADAEAEQRLADRTLFSDDRLGDALALLDRHYKLTVIDPAAALAARVLPYADQLVLVVPASEEAPDAVEMTYEWLDGHGCADLRRRAVMVVNGVSRRSMPDVEQAEAVASGRCRAIVRVPWEDDLAPGGVEVVDPGRLRTAGRRAYLALAGVVVAGFAAQKVRPSEEELASDPPGTRIGER